MSFENKPLPVCTPEEMGVPSSAIETYVRELLDQRLAVSSLSASRRMTFWWSPQAMNSSTTAPSKFTTPSGAKFCPNCLTRRCPLIPRRMPLFSHWALLWKCSVRTARSHRPWRRRYRALPMKWPTTRWDSSGCVSNSRLIRASCITKTLPACTPFPLDSASR